jgi:dTMP kinase
VNFRATSSAGGPNDGPPGHPVVRSRKPKRDGVLSVKPFRRLWIAQSLSSLGDWLSIVALSALAPSLTSGGAVA